MQIMSVTSELLIICYEIAFTSRLAAARLPALQYDASKTHSNQQQLLKKTISHNWHDIEDECTQRPQLHHEHEADEQTRLGNCLRAMPSTCIYSSSSFTDEVFVV